MADPLELGDATSYSPVGPVGPWVAPQGVAGGVRAGDAALGSQLQHASADDGGMEGREL